MGRIRTYPPVKLFAAVSLADLRLWEAVRRKLETVFSPIDMEMDWYDFHHTDYYREEMGEGLKKRMVSFTELINAETLPECKLRSNALEEEFAEGKLRRVNLDPGYLCAPKMVLATTKDYSHRIYLSKGIFADLHLVYQHKRFTPQPWTYPDYQEPFVLQFFERLRDIYLAQLAGTEF